MEISVSTKSSQDAARMVHFKTMQIPDLNSLAFTILNRPWSPCVWNTGYRAKTNFLHSDFCALDFDTGELTVAAAIELLKSDNLAGVVGITQSHQKQKKEQAPCDRFRLILPWESRITDLATYEQNMARLVSCLPADSACKDGARYFWPCADIVYEQDGDKFAWQPYQAPPPKVIRRIPQHLRQVPQWMQAELSRPIPPGSRNRTTFRFACHLKRSGFNEQDAAELLAGPSGLDQHELITTIRSAFRSE